MKAAIKALVDLGKTGKQNVAYGVLSTLVNLTNSFDKQVRYLYFNLSWVHLFRIFYLDTSHRQVGRQM